MSSQFKWNDKPEDKDLDYVVVLMISRNKDNKDIEGFKERKHSFLAKNNLNKICERFNFFVSQGLSGEMCRLYISLNTRETSLIRNELLHMLIDKEDISWEYIDSMIAAIAARKECAKTKYWFFDFDSQNKNKLKDFCNDINEIDSTVEITTNITPHGYAVIVHHGFDTRKLMEKWGDIATLKRDDLICINWSVRE